MGKHKRTKDASRNTKRTRLDDKSRADHGTERGTLYKYVYRYLCLATYLSFLAWTDVGKIMENRMRDVRVIFGIPLQLDAENTREPQQGIGGT